MPRIYKDCVDCGIEFFISEKAQAFFATKTDYVLPKRCYECRRVRKNRKSATGAVVRAATTPTATATATVAPTTTQFFIPADQQPDDSARPHGHKEYREAGASTAFAEVWGRRRMLRRRRRDERGSS